MYFTNGKDYFEDLLKINGRIIVVSFHSLEDKIVKDIFNAKIGKNAGISRYVPIIAEDVVKPNFTVLTKNAIQASDEEVNYNPRSRSAKLRAIKKTGENLC